MSKSINEKNHFLRLSWIKCTAIVGVIFILFGLMAILAISLFSNNIEKIYSNTALISQICIGIVFLFLIRKYPLSSGRVSLTKSTLYSVLIILAISIIYAIIAFICHPSFWNDYTQTLDGYDQFSRLNFSHFLIAYILAPIIEEGLFRGIILRGLLNKYSALFSIIFSSILFAVVHIEPSIFISTFLVGLIIGVVYYRTKSLGLVILFHLFFNVIADIFYYNFLFFVDFILSDIYYGVVLFGVIFIVFLLNKFDLSSK